MIALRHGLLMLLWAVPPWLAAQDKYGGELFEFPGDAQSVAMAGVGVARSHEAATGFYNPAQLALVSQPSIMLAHREQFGGIVSADLLAINLRGTSELAVQVGLVRRGVNDIPDTREALLDLNDDGVLDDNERLDPDKIRYFDQREWGVLLSVARRHQPGWGWGVNVKLLGNWLADELGLGLGFDLGIRRDLSPALSLGLMLQDITTTQVYWSTGRWATTAPRATAGLGWQLTLPIVQWHLALEGELTTRFDGLRLEQAFALGPASVLMRTGGELAINDNLRLRAGSATLFPLTLGAGLTFSAFSLDYAYVGNTRAGVFQPTHQLSVTLFLETLRELLEAG